MEDIDTDKIERELEEALGEVKHLRERIRRGEQFTPSEVAEVADKAALPYGAMKLVHYSGDPFYCNKMIAARDALRELLMSAIDRFGDMRAERLKNQTTEPTA